ncbi:MAG: flagellar export protein FliJ [bacterium]|nr:flagellar export protein FliJ [bacterium]|tara:strand:- start:61 stop:525 length:465 start_codon:yes stop_codon:yes gene_type:complete
MKAFKFKLRAVQRLKELKLDEIERQIVTLVNIFENEQKQLRLLFEEKTQVRANRNKYQLDLNFVMVEFSRKYEENLAYKISSQELRVAEANTNLKQAKQNRMEALNERRIMDKLEEVEYKKFSLKRARFEQNQLDDINSLRFARKSSSVKVDGE